MYFADITGSMSIETFKHFKYEIALGAPLPMPKPVINFYPHNQYSVQQYLHTLCKEHIGSLGKRNGRWEFGPEVPEDVRLGARPDIIEVFDFAERMGIIEPKSSGQPTAIPDDNAFIVYQLSKAYWKSFDKFDQ